jgi:hypothetical protein
MTYDGKNPAFEHVINQEKVATTSVALAATFASIRESLRAVLTDKDAVRLIRKGVIFQQLVFADERLIILPYLFSGDTGHGPAIECSSDDAMFSTFRSEFEDLWEMNAEPDAQ